jgi:hypothetical protein
MAAHTRLIFMDEVTDQDRALAAIAEAHSAARMGDYATASLYLKDATVSVLHLGEQRGQLQAPQREGDATWQVVDETSPSVIVWPGGRREYRRIPHPLPLVIRLRHYRGQTLLEPAPTGCD